MRLKPKFGVLLSVLLYRCCLILHKFFLEMNKELMSFIEYLLCKNVHFTVTSALRSASQNKACNGVPTSQHLTGDAIDMAPVDMSAKDLFNYVKSIPGIAYDQLILYKTFIHISFARNRAPRMQILFK